MKGIYYRILFLIIVLLPIVAFGSKFTISNDLFQLENIMDNNTSLIFYSSILISIIFILYIVSLVKRLILKKTSDATLKKEIEEHKQTAQSLKISQERFDLAMKGSNDGLWDRDLINNTVYYSERWKSMLGFLDNEFPNNIKSFENRIHPEDIEKVMSMFHNHLNKKTDFYENKFRVKHKDGHFIWILDRGKAIFNKDGKPIRIVGTHTDITEKQKIEEELHQYQTHLKEKVQERTTELQKAKEKAEESDRLKSAFLANMSHEIRTPMNAIIGFTDLLADPDLNEIQKEELIDYINKNSNTLVYLIDDIIDLAKIEAGQLKINKAETNINQILKDVIHSFYETNNLNESDQVKLKLNKGIESDNFTINTDPIRFQQILINLIGNAIKYTEQGFIDCGYVVKTEKNNSFLEFFIKDTGVGIPKDKHKQIFERFNKLECSKTKLYRGTGLGLTITKNLVEMLGGEIWLNSEENKGSTFYFTILIEEFKGQLNTDNIEIDDSIKDWKNNTILIAEDEDSNYRVLQMALKRTNVNILRAENGKQAIDICRANKKINLVLMDLKMPEVNGIEATKEIKKVRPDLPIIAQTAYAMTEDKKSTLEAGCVDYLSKPIKANVLISTLNKYM
ncbi:response regulator [Bacteroidota bacterium]